MSETESPERQRVCPYGGRWVQPNTPDMVCGEAGYVCLRCQLDAADARHDDQVRLGQAQLEWLKDTEMTRRYPSSGDVLAEQMRDLLSEVKWLRSRINDLEMDQAKRRGPA
jgi:hypothetical protein